jgi:hypothetical protein
MGKLQRKQDSSNTAIIYHQRTKKTESMGQAGKAEF